MIWIDNIEDLQYYNNAPDMPCYCDELFSPSDITLQANLGSGVNGISSVVVELFSADGLTNNGNITPNFDWFLFQGTDGNWYINFVCISFPITMCDLKCFILKVTVLSSMLELPYFSKFTERYCLDNCCIVPSIISIQDA